MRFNVEVIPVGKGRYGPFKSKTEGEPDEFYDYLDLAAVDGTGSERATIAQGVTFDPELFKPCVVQLEMHGQQRKLRCHGAAVAKPLAKVA